MPLMMRRAVFRTGLAASATLAAVLLARKQWPAAFGGTDQPEPEPASAAPTPPPSLRDVAASLVAVTPSAPLPSFPVTTVAPDGRVSAAPIDRLFGSRGTVLNLWATWCGPCRREMASLAHLAATLRADGIAVLPVSIDRGGIDAIRVFYRTDAIGTLPILADPDGAADRALSLGAIPVTFVLDAAGRVAGRLDGGADWSTPDATRAVQRLV